MSNYLIKNYPEYYHYYKEKEFTWDRTGGDPITQGNETHYFIKIWVLTELKQVIFQLSNIH